MRVGRYDVPVSNPDKIFFPKAGLTKGDVVAVLRGRAPSARCRICGGGRSTCSGSRTASTASSSTRSGCRRSTRSTSDEVPVSFPSGHSTVFAVIDNAAALAWVANLGCIELHTWHSRVPEIEQPDYLLIDLDPTRRRAVGLRARDRARRAGGDGRARAGVVPEDVGGDRASHPGADPPGAAVPGGARGSRRRSPRRSSGGSATSRSRRRPGGWRTAIGVFVDFGQNARDRTIASRLLGPADARTRASRRRSAGTRSRRSNRRRSRSRRCAPASPRPATRCEECGGGRSRSAALRAARPRPAHLPRRAGHVRYLLRHAPADPQLDAGLSAGGIPFQTCVPATERCVWRTPSKSDSTPAAAAALAGRSSRQVQSCGALSSRQRISFVPWRKRLP